MAKTMVGVGDAKQIKKYSGLLAVDVAKESYFMSSLVGTGPATYMPIQRVTDLEKGAGDEVTYDLSLQLRGQPTESGEVLDGNEEDLRFASGALYIDVMRKAVSAGDKMTQKRTLYDLRAIAKARLTEWWTRIYDEIIFVYLSGMRGINSDYILALGWQGHARNPIVPPDDLHHIYGGVATSFATLQASDKLDLSVIDKIVLRADMMGGGTQATPSIKPCKVPDSQTNAFVLLMSPYQEYSVRTNSSTGQWLDIQKAAASADGKNNPIFKGGLGMYNDTILKKHKNVIRFNNAGAGANVAGARALLLGCQAGIIAFGQAGQGMSFDWIEETKDYGETLNVGSRSVFGFKKAGYEINGSNLDFGVIAVDTAIDTAPSGLPQ